MHAVATKTSKQVPDKDLSLLQPPPRPLPHGHVSLLKLLVERLERNWLEDQPISENGIIKSIYDTRIYLRRRAPNEIETVLATIDQTALNMVEQGFSNTFGIFQFTQAIVSAGTYDSNHVMAYLGGIVDLFFEVLWSQADRSDGAPPSTVRWGQLMNHFIESPEIAMYESSEGGKGIALQDQGGSRDNNAPQMKKGSFADVAKHYGQTIGKILWFPSLDALATCEGTESLLLWTPSPGWEQARLLTPQLPESFYNEAGEPLWTVFAVAWDAEMQDIVVLLSNRLIVQWRLRNREKFQFQQKRELRVSADKLPFQTSSDTLGRSANDPAYTWKVCLKLVDKADDKDRAVLPRSKSEASKFSIPDARGLAKSRTQLHAHTHDAQAEARMKKGLRDDLEAQEIATQLDIWWNASMKLWVTTDKRGTLYFWDLRRFEAVVTDRVFPPVHRLPHINRSAQDSKPTMGHTKAVTSHLEIGKTKFVTCSLDRTVILWDNKNMTMDIKITDHAASVLCQAYLPLFSSLVSVGCEKKVFVWTIDSNAYRGVRAKLSAHQANLMSVSAGQRVFVTLDEASITLLWDAATLTCLQSVNAATQLPVHVICLPSIGRICIVGRRINFYEGNESLEDLLGMVPTKEQLERRKRQAELLGSIKERALPRYCGLNMRRGCMLTATEMEVRLHARGDPAQSRILFNAPEGDQISSFVTMDDLSLCVLGTSKGRIHILKYRSGFALKVYPGRKEEAQKAAAAKTQRAATVTGQSSSEADAARQRATPSNAASRTTSPAAGVSIMAPSPTMASGAPRYSAMSSTSTGPAVDSQDSGGDGGGAMAGAGLRGQMPQPDDNAPTPEEIAHGLSSQVTCIFACEERRLIFVGTGEGRVIVIECGGDFPVKRWFKTDDKSEVTCLHCSTQGEGLLAVGTNDGAAHLYNLSCFRLAGTVSIPRLLSETDPGGNSTALRHIRPLEAPCDLTPFPCTLLTIDVQSRMRFWGVRIDEHTGKMCELALIVDAGQMRTLEEVFGAVVSPFRKKSKDIGRTSKFQERVKSTSTSGQKVSVVEPSSLSFRRGAIDIDVGDGEEFATDDLGEGEDRHSDNGDGLSDGQSSTQSGIDSFGVDDDGSGVCINVIAMYPPDVTLPVSTFDKIRWLEDWRSRPPRGPQEEARPEPKPEPVKLPPPPQRGGRKKSKKSCTRGKVTLRPGLFAAEAASAIAEIEEYDTEGDDDGTVAGRYANRPRTPPLRTDGDPSTAAAGLGNIGWQHGAAADSADGRGPNGGGKSSIVGGKNQPDELELPPLPPEPAVVEASGSNVMFLADTSGYIWCVDVGQTIKAALKSCKPIPVVLDTLLRQARESPTGAVPRKMKWASQLRQMRSMRTFPHLRSAAVSHSSLDDIAQPYLAGSAPPSMPHLVKVLGAWRAHESGILSLVPVLTPCALVSADKSKEVKVWSTGGELWAHFTLNGPDGRVPASIVWPPPHTLAAQLALMSISKGLARRLNLSDKARQAARGRRRTLRQASRESPYMECSGSRESSRSDRRERSVGSRVSRAPTKELRPAGNAGGGIGEAIANDMLAVARLARRQGAGGEDSRQQEDRPATAPCSSPVGASSASAGAELDKDPLEHTEDAIGMSSSGAGGEPARSFTSSQISEMIRTHAFSAGFQSYKKFERSGYMNHAETSVSRSRGKIVVGAKILEAERAHICKRKPEAFGVALNTEAERKTWQHAAYSLPHRSVSDGALLRYAQSNAEDMAWAVKQSLGIDVSKTTKKELRRKSFAARLDVGGVSLDPLDPTTATAQAVKRILEKKGRSKETGYASLGAINQGPRAKNKEPLSSM